MRSITLMDVNSISLKLEVNTDCHGIVRLEANGIMLLEMYAQPIPGGDLKPHEQFDTEIAVRYYQVKTQAILPNSQFRKSK